MKKREYHLAISVSHNSSAALIKDGEIIVAICEERSRRKKNYTGFPMNAVDYCLKTGGVTAEDISRVAYTTVDNPGLIIKSKMFTEFSLQDYRDYYGDRYYKRRLQGESCVDYLRWLRDDPKFNKDEEYFDFSFLSDDVIVNDQLSYQLFRKESARLLASKLGIGEERIEFLDHHTCHAYYAYFGSPYRTQDCISLTLDSWGDGRNQTVWKVCDDLFTPLAESNENDLARIYRMATLILGMRPDEHEFKVMGLAPYAKRSHVESAMEVLTDLCDVDGLRIVSKNRPKDLFSYLDEAWKTHRFDNIAGAVQLFTENLVCKLVRNIVLQTNIRRFVIGGGMALNIKMNKAIADLKEVNDIFVCGSPGDESLSIGGCYFLNSNSKSNQPLKNLYLGYNLRDDFSEFDATNLLSKYDVKLDATHDDVAKLLFNGDIVASVRGRAEFGARALGNRSILADPSKLSAVKKINEAIKNRDFWMPFALSILEEKSDDYILNPKKLKSPFMAISFDAKKESFSKIQSGAHPYDQSIRPQFVSAHSAPEYHSLINAFNRLSGIPAVLNTSFNLHGEPIVDSIADALRTFERSGLDHLLIEDTCLISKKRD